MMFHSDNGENWRKRSLSFYEHCMERRARRCDVFLMSWETIFGGHYDTTGCKLVCFYALLKRHSDSVAFFMTSIASSL